MERKAQLYAKIPLSYYYLKFLKILFGSLDDSLLSSDGASIFIAIHVYKIPVSNLYVILLKFS